MKDAIHLLVNIHILHSMACISLLTHTTQYINIPLMIHVHVDVDVCAQYHPLMLAYPMGMDSALTDEVWG